MTLSRAIALDLMRSLLFTPDQFHISFLLSQEFDLLQTHGFAISIGLGVGYAYRLFDYMKSENEWYDYMMHFIQMKEYLSIRYQFSDLFTLGVSSGVSEFAGTGKYHRTYDTWDSDWYGDIMISVDYRLQFIFNL